MLLNPFFEVNVLHCGVVLGVRTCCVMVVFVFYLVQDPFILAHAIGALLYLCIHWSVQHQKYIQVFFVIYPNKVVFVRKKEKLSL